MFIEPTVFEKMVRTAIDGIPRKYGEHIRNVAFVVEDSPSQEQRTKLHLVNGQTLFGLYEGIPLTKRSSGYNLVLPDKITIFREPIMYLAATVDEAQAQVNKTVWHEVAHYFGLDHNQIHNLEQSK